MEPPGSRLAAECKGIYYRKAEEILESRKTQGEKEEGWKGAKIFTTSNLTALICLGEDAYLPDDVFILD